MSGEPVPDSEEDDSDYVQGVLVVIEGAHVPSVPHNDFEVAPGSRAVVQAGAAFEARPTDSCNQEHRAPRALSLRAWSDTLMCFGPYAADIFSATL